MGSASMLLASSGMLSDDLSACCKSHELLDSNRELCSRLAANMPARASRMLAIPNRVALLTRSRHRDDEFAVFLGDKVFGAAG